MSDKTILHIKVADGSVPVTDDELERLKDVINDGLEDWGLDDEYEGFVTGGDVSIHDVPALDSYVDEVAERVVEKLEEQE